MRTKNTLPLLAILTTALLIFTTGCGDHDDEHGHDEGDNSHSHANGGPNDNSGPNGNNGGVAALALMACDMTDVGGHAVTAAGTIEEASDVTVTEDHPFKVSVDGKGFVTFTPPKPHTSWITFTDQADIVGTVFRDGDIFDTPSGSANGECAEDIAGQYTLHMHETEPYVIELNGTGDVWLLLLPGEEGHDGSGDENSGEHEHNSAEHNSAEHNSVEDHGDHGG